MRDAAARRVGRSVARESPQSSTRRRSGGGRRWSTCIKRWNVATLSPRRRGDTARPTQGDRRKPRERRRSPKRRQVGGAGKSSVLHPKAQRRRQAVEHLHQAVERRHALPQAEGRHRAAHEHTTRRIGRSVAGVDQNPLASRHLHQARQSRPPGRRPSAGRAGKAWRNHVEPERAVRGWPWATVRSRREKTAPPPCPRAGGRCGVNESMWTSGKNLT